MKTVLKIVLPVLVLGLGFAARQWLLDHAPQEERAPLPQRPAAVRVATARPGPVRLTVLAHGELRAAREAALAAEVGGRVAWIGAGLEPGAGFAAGEELLRLDPTDAEQALARARAERKRAAAALEIERAAAASARADWEEFGSGEPSPAALREPQLALAAAALEAAEAGVAAAETARARCSVRAPFAGRCLSRAAVPGSVVAPGAPLARLQSVEDLQARVVLDATDLRALGHAGGAPPPARARVRAPLGPEGGWSARLLRLEAEVDPRDRTIGAILALETGPDEPPPPAGQFVTAEIEGRELEAVTRVPPSAVRDGGVWLADAAGTLRRAAVEIAGGIEGDLLVRGIADGARVCLEPPAIAVDGMRVEAVEDR